MVATKEIPPQAKQQSFASSQESQNACLWLKAIYHFYVFHYRMPDTVAIAAITPFVPSPLTVKMSMVAALLQRGEHNEAERLAPALPQIEVRVVPPSAAFSFKAFLRYRSVPAVESAISLDETGSFYPSRPHTREYALFADDLTVFIGLRDGQLKPVVEKALCSIRYLGCKDSQVWCRKVEVVTFDEVQGAPHVVPFSEGLTGVMILGADFADDARLTLKDLIPGSRKKEHYRNSPFVLPGRIFVKGRARIFVRRDV
ncbi:hypothetical protein ACP6EK_03315 [Candidatus Caldatribacterium sp. SIUC1]|uniref:hypothetical protein n=1 Tax=Candidatus Caldatribacterium sp. SIUC1 TaxID=3418365 RepID=UPI003F68E5CA